MNLRISQNEFRFRLSQEELTQLCSGTSLAQSNPLPGSGALVISIRLSSIASTALHLEWQNNHLILTVDRDAAQELLELLPKKDGLEVHQLLGDGQSLELQLEIDIRTQKRNRSDKEGA